MNNGIIKFCIYTSVIQIPVYAKENVQNFQKAVNSITNKKLMLDLLKNWIYRNFLRN